MATMAPTLYMFHESPPSRAVMMTAKAIGLSLKLKEISYLDQDNLKPEFLKVSASGLKVVAIVNFGSLTHNTQCPFLWKIVVSRYGIVTPL